MSKERGVREVLETGCVVCHGVVVSWEELGDVAIAVCTLVATRVIAEVGSGPVAGDGSTRHS